MIKKINEAKFLKILKHNPLEDVETILHVEKLFVKKRGYTSKMPAKGSNVILLVSGGIDSISSWAILLEEYGLKVHPICINTGQKRHREELKAVHYFSKIFKKLYPSLYIEPFKLTFPTSAPEISSKLHGNLSKTIHPKVLNKNFDPTTNTVPLTRKYLFPAFFPYQAALAALFFDLQRNTKIRTIFCSILPTDGEYNASQTLTSIRGSALSLSTFTNDYTWQVISICFEKELGFLLYKSDLILWSYQHKIPIEHSYTCFRGTKLHCGECLVCKVRKKSFLKAGVLDKTVYQDKKLESKKNLKAFLPITKLVKFIKRRRKIFIKDYY